MATNFRIFVHRNADSLHLELSGDFDGSSASELLHAVKSHRKKEERIFLHTNGLGGGLSFRPGHISNEIF